MQQLRKDSLPKMIGASSQTEEERNLQSIWSNLFYSVKYKIFIKDMMHVTKNSNGTDFWVQITYTTTWNRSLVATVCIGTELFCFGRYAFIRKLKDWTTLNGKRFPSLDAW